MSAPVGDKALPDPPGAYRPVPEYGFVGNRRTVALIGPDGSVDWFCLPRFDSPSVFAALIDHEHGGHFQVSPAAAGEGRQSYLPGTDVLVTTFETRRGGRLEITDFMPAVEAPGLSESTSLYRRVRCLRGNHDVDVHFDPRFGYASSPGADRSPRAEARGQERAPSIQTIEGGVRAMGKRDDEVLTLSTDARIVWAWAQGFLFDEEGDASSLERERYSGAIFGRIRMFEGETRWIVLRHGDGRVRPPVAPEPDERLVATIGEHRARGTACEEGAPSKALRPASVSPAEAAGRSRLLDGPFAGDV